MRQPTLQLKVLRAISSLSLRYGYPPTLQEIAIEIGFLSKTSITKAIAGLLEKRLVNSKKGAARTLLVTLAGNLALASGVVPIRHNPDNGEQMDSVGP